MSDDFHLTLNQLSNKIKKFDICSLFKVLENLNHPFDSLFFNSNLSYASSTSLCEGINLKEVFDLPRVVLNVNLGILTGSSPLPTYFRKCMDKELIDEDQFIQFISFFDQHLIKNLFQMSMPEKFFFDDWNWMTHNHMHLFGLNSSSSIHWLMQLCFPELHVHVEKKRIQSKLKLDSLLLGKSHLGKNTVLGGYVEHSIFTFHVILSLEEQQLDTSYCLPLEVRKRFVELVLPLIKKARVPIAILLKINPYNFPAKLSTQSYLGYGRLGDSELPMTFPIIDIQSATFNKTEH